MTMVLHSGLAASSRRVAWRFMAAGHLFLILWLGGVTGNAAASPDLQRGPLRHSTLSTGGTDGINRRDLQSDSRLFDVSPPVMSYSGMKLEMEHTVRDQVQTSMVRIDLFRDDACSMSIDSNDYLAVEIINDLADFGDGSGTRQITVNYVINPSTIDNSRIIAYSDGFPIVSFCTRFNIIDPATNQVANFLDTVVALRVDITERFQIMAILEDEEDSYAVEAFECDSENKPITEQTLKRQGSLVRVCVQPDAFTQGFAVVMKSISQMKFIRGDVSDEIIAPDGVIRDMVQTQYRCTAGDPLCSVTTEVSNQFFYSRGLVNVQGVAWLQYAGSAGNRHLLEVPFQVPMKDNNDNAPKPEMAAPLSRNRQALEAGAYIGARDFNLTFEVEPSGTDWNSTAFLCDGRNVPLQGSALTKPRNKDDLIRVCVMPSAEARQRGVYVRGISSFYFEQGELTQFAIRPTGIQANNSLYICNAGEPLCAFKIELDDEFFDKNLQVSGVGEVLLQYGTDPLTYTNTSRRLQDDEADPTVDAGFAGRTRVTVQFTTDPTYVPPSELTWQEKADQWWHDTPLFLRIVYVMAVIIGILILLCFLWAICCGNPFAKKKTAPAGQSRKMFIQPVFMRGRNKGDEGDEDDAVKEGDYQDKDANYDWEVGAEDNGISASRRLENGQMAAVPETESAHFSTPTPGTNDSYPKIEPDYAKSPKRKSSQRSSANCSDADSVRSGSRRNSSNGSSKSPKPKRKSSIKMLEDGPATPKSPKRRSSVGSTASAGKSPKLKRKSSVKLLEDGAPTKSPSKKSSISVASSAGKSPKSNRKSSINSATSSTGNSPKASRKSSINLDGSASSVGKSPKAKRRVTEGSLSDSAQFSSSSPKPRRSKRAMGSTGSLPRASVSSSKSPLPRRGGKAPTGASGESLKSPGGRPSTSMRTPATAPAGNRRVAKADKLPDALPF